MKKYIGLALMAFLVSCKSTKAVVSEGNATTNSKTSADKVIAGHYAIKRDFKTAYIKANAKYKDPKQSQTVSAEIRIKKDELISVSVRFLGITMAKALITPTEVKYYEKLGGHYFEGDYKALSQWLGTDLDFQKVQNLLIGQPLDNLEKGNYKTSTADNLYKVESTKDAATRKEFYFEPEKFLLKKESVSQDAQQRALQVLYPNYNQFAEAIMPASVVIDATQPKGKTNINIDYSSVSFNEELTFPYSVPEGYERITIK